MPETGSRPVELEDISAVTLAVRDMARSVAFYRALGFRPVEERSGPSFTTFALRASYLNLIAPGPPGAVDVHGWGRVIVHVSDVDALHARAVAAGLEPDFAPRDAPWGERYFHIRDPDGHEISLARPL